MYHALYTIIVFTINPTLSTDFKALGDNQYYVREGMTRHLASSLPGWTAPFFNYYAAKSDDVRFRARCARVHRRLDLKWKVNLILYFFPSIPTDIEAMGYRLSYKVREEATKRLESLPGFTAIYFKYHASKTRDPLVRTSCEKMYEKLEYKWRYDLFRLSMEIRKVEITARAAEMRERIAATIATNLAKLTPEDRKLALTQGYCPIQFDVALGEKGVPVKIMLEGQPVFLCCKECIKKAQADRWYTLTRLEEAKKSVSPEAITRLEERIKQISKSSSDKK